MHADLGRVEAGDDSALLLSTIALAHRVANLSNPCSDEFVQLEIKGLYNVMSAR